MKDFVLNNIVAEMQAVANSLHTALKSGLVQAGDEVLLQTDCVPAIDAFESKRVRLVAAEHEVVTVLHQLQERFQLAITFRHVKGHSRLRGARYTTNKLCDRRAKDAMRKARHRVRINELKGILK